MERTRQICSANGAATGNAGLGGRIRLLRGRTRSTRLTRGARLAAGALCGAGVALFPGIALLALQLSLVLVWTYLMLSMALRSLHRADLPR